MCVCRCRLSTTGGTPSSARVLFPDPPLRHSSVSVSIAFLRGPGGLSPLRGFLCSVVVFLLPQLWLLVFRSRPAPGRPPAGKALCAGRLPQPRSGLTGAGP